MRRDRGTSPMPFDRFNRMKIYIEPGENVRIIPQPQPPAFGHIRPWLRNLGLIGLGALGYRYYKPILKLGQKAINYASDKFHHLFTPTNETTEQLGNRAAF